MLDALRTHWRAYMMEAAGLAGFIIVASAVTTLLDHPDLFVMRGELGNYPLLRRIPLALVMGVYIAAISRMCGERSGAHINPAVTLAFFRLDKIDRCSACFYVIAQFVGAIFGALLMTFVLGSLYEHPSIHHVTTSPGAGANAIEKAFIAEFIISFILMLVILIAISSKRLKQHAAVIIGVLLAIYLVFETPYSGMSMNPARSFGSAFAAGHWRDLWIYFTAPVLAMLLAAEIFMLLERRFLRGAPWHKECPSYPIVEATPA